MNTSNLPLSKIQRTKFFVRLFLVLSLFTTFVCSNYVYAGKEKEAIAIVDFSGQNVSAMDAAVVSGFLRTALVNLKVYKVIDRSNMESLLAEQGFQMTGCTTQECAVKIGKMLNVQKMVMGSLSKLMDTYYITANIVDVQTGEIIASQREKSSYAEGLADATDRLADNLVHGKVATIAKYEPIVPVRSAPVVTSQIVGVKQVRSSRRASTVRGFMDVFLGSGGGKMDLTFANTRSTIYEGHLYFRGVSNRGMGEVVFEELQTESTSKPWGIRLGIYDKIIGGDFEISSTSQYLKRQDTTVTIDGYRTIDFDFTLRDYIQVDMFTMAMDMFLQTEGKVLRPYVGGGFGLSINKVTSPYIYSYKGRIWKKGLDQTNPGFLIRGFFGMRLMLGKVSSMFLEYRTTTNRFTFDRNIKYETDTIVMRLGQTLVGMSFGF